MKQLISLLIGLLVILIIAVGGYYLFTRLSCTPETEYGIKINGNIYRDGDTAELKYGFNELELIRPAGTGGTAALEIHRNPEMDFDFKADGKTMQFSALDNVTGAFDLSTGENGKPHLTIPESLTMTDILQRLFQANTITDVPKEANAMAESYFNLLVKFGEKEIRIKLFLGTLVTGIELDSPGIIF